MKNSIGVDRRVKYIIGIDEVGRGPIAGPVCVASFMMQYNYELPINDYELKLPKLRDSKKLSKKQREVWFEFLTEEKKKGNCDFTFSFVSNENIDKFGIVKCIQKALNESLKKVTTQNNIQNTSQDSENSFLFTPKGPYEIKNFQNLASYFVYLDGGLHAPKEFINQKTIIKGDELYPVISLASIVAKVSRDKVMTNYGKEYPEYGFEKHVGYGTKTHYDAIKKHGQIPIHRKSFIH